jgi:2',3'-cyclic-nucleotide 2'-phosphodiesterase (5'-nucleotidase family)
LHTKSSSLFGIYQGWRTLCLLWRQAFGEYMNRRLFLALFFLAATLNTAFAAPAGKAMGPFDNTRPDKTETVWGRLVADSLRATAKTDMAIVHAGVLQRGTLAAGPVEAAQVNALFAFPEDDVVTMKISGAQLRAALERAVQAYPTGSAAMLHLSGLEANFNAQAPINRRITLVRVAGKEVKDGDTFTVALPVSLAEGGAGYYTIWNNRNTTKTGVSLGAAVVNYIKAQTTVTPDREPRFALQ